MRALRAHRGARIADAFEQDGSWLIVGILRHELAFEGALADGLAKATRHDVHGLMVLHDPAAGRELAVNLLPGLFLGGHGHEPLLLCRESYPQE